jgi:hypothetical protein
VQLSLMPAVSAQSATSGQIPHTSNNVVEPPELVGQAQPIQTPPSPATLQFAESKKIQAADPQDAKTLAPAIGELTALIRLEPTNSDFRLLRATLSCYLRANSTDILDDIAKSISLHSGSKSTAYHTLKEHYALRAKVEFESGHFEDSMRDLDAAIKEDYGNAEGVFDDGKIEPSTTTQPCVWTKPDLEALEHRFPKDYRPPLYRGLYLNFFDRFNLESDHSVALDALRKGSWSFRMSRILTGARPFTQTTAGITSITGNELHDERTAEISVTVRRMGLASQRLE